MAAGIGCRPARRHRRCRVRCGGRCRRWSLPQGGHMGADLGVLRRTDSGGEDDHAAARHVRIGVGGRIGAEQSSRPSARAVARSPGLGPYGGDVEVERLVEQLFLRAEGGVEARLGDAQARAEIAHRRALVAALPEQAHGLVERLGAIELSWAACQNRVFSVIVPVSIKLLTADRNRRIVNCVTIGTKWRSDMTDQLALSGRAAPSSPAAAAASGLPLHWPSPRPGRRRHHLRAQWRAGRRGAGRDRSRGAAGAGAEGRFRPR